MTKMSSCLGSFQLIGICICMIAALSPFCCAISSSEVSFQVRQNRVSYPSITKVEASDLYMVSVNSVAVFTEKYNDIHYTHFSFREKPNIVVTVDKDIRSYTLSPEDYKIPSNIEGRKLSFTIDQPRKLVIRVNDDERLFIFADPIKTDPHKPHDPKFVNLLDFGVDSTGKVLETKRMQKAIEGLQENGILYLPAGIYQTGTLYLKSNMTLFLADGAMLKGAPSYEHYPSDRIGRRLLMIADSDNVTIKGRGIIDGNGAAVFKSGEKVHLITLKNSSNVLIEDVFLRNSASWNTHILYCNGVTVRNVKMINDVSLSNTDGFDPDSSCNVLIEDSFIYAGDDAIAVKTSNRGEFLRDLTDNIFRNNVVLTQKSALKIGTETRADRMNNIKFVNNHVIQSDRAMAIYCNDGADISDVQFVGNYFEENYPDSKRRMIHFQIKNRDGAGQIRNILIKDCCFKKPFPQNSTIDGLGPEHTIRNIRFENLSIAGELCRNAEDAYLDIGEYVKDVVFDITK